ncbi:MAG: TolC family protein [Candidatus Rokubacteria bacterium]|nr:TolC family protein [Candidatus Rokubacteria bacterium]
MRLRTPGPTGPARVLCALPLFLAVVGAVGPATAQAPAALPPATAPTRAAPAPAQVLSLPEAIELALRQQPTIRSAAQGRAAAVARVPQAQSPYYPQLDVVGSAGRSQTFSSTLNQAFQSNSISALILGRQLLYDFGKTGALVDEARANLRFSEEELERVRDVVVVNVRQAYYQLLQAQRLVAVADAQVGRADLNLRSAQGFFEVGTKPKSDVTKAEVEVANARVAQIRARNLVQFNQVNLASTLGLEATTPLQIQDILNYEPISIDPAALRTEALANRPELAQARARIDAARAQLAGAWAGYLPDLTVTGSYGAAASDPPLHEVWSITGNLSWNLFQGFFTQSRVAETQALTDAARANYDALELQVRLDVEQAYIAVVDAAERIAATAKAVESARENLRLAQGRYDAGVGTILDLTDAQLSLTNAEADQVRALTDHKLALAALDRAVGRP